MLKGETVSKMCMIRFLHSRTEQVIKETKQTCLHWKAADFKCQKRNTDNKAIELPNEDKMIRDALKRVENGAQP